MDEWEVKIIQANFKLGFNVFFFRKGFRKIEVLQSDGTVLAKDEGMDIAPTIYLEKHMLEAFGVAIQRIGIKTPDVGETAGKLTAQTAHLQDLRKLLKLEK